MAQTRKQLRERREALIILRTMANRVIWYSGGRDGTGLTWYGQANREALEAHKFAQLAWREYEKAGRGMVS